MMSGTKAEADGERGARKNGAGVRTGILVIAVFLTLFLLVLKVWNVFGSDAAGWMAYVLAVCCGGLWISALVLSCRARRPFGAVVSLVLLAAVAAAAWMPVNGVRFAMMRNAYEEYAENAYQTVLAEAPEGVYLPLYGEGNPMAVPVELESRPLLGKIGFVKGAAGSAIVFEDRYTTFDYWCYVRVFSGDGVEAMFPDYDLAAVIDLGGDWYFVDFF